MRRPVGEISISYLIYHIYSYVLHIPYPYIIYMYMYIYVYVYIYIHIYFMYPCSSFVPIASCFNITRINTPITWHLDYCCEVHDSIKPDWCIDVQHIRACWRCGRRTIPVISKIWNIAWRQHLDVKMWINSLSGKLLMPRSEEKTGEWKMGAIDCR